MPSTTRSGAFFMPKENAVPGEFEAIAASQIRAIDGGWRIKTTATHHIDVLSMIYNDRIVTTPVEAPLEYDRFWCYPKGGAAILAALAWDGDENTEPVGWHKSYDGRRHTQGETP